MAQLLGIILLIGLAVFALKLAILFFLLAGLIFRTKETIGLILIFAILAGFRTYPLPCIAIIAVLLPVSIYLKRREKNSAAVKQNLVPPAPEE